MEQRDQESARESTLVTGSGGRGFWGARGPCLV